MTVSIVGSVEAAVAGADEGGVWARSTPAHAMNVTVAPVTAGQVIRLDPIFHRIGGFYQIMNAETRPTVGRRLVDQRRLHYLDVRRAPIA